MDASFSLPFTECRPWCQGSNRMILSNQGLAFAGESRRASHHRKRGRALDGVGRQGLPVLRHVQGLQEDAQGLNTQYRSLE